MLIFKDTKQFSSYIENVIMRIQYYKTLFNNIQEITIEDLIKRISTVADIKFIDPLKHLLKIKQSFNSHADKNMLTIEDLSLTYRSFDESILLFCIYDYIIKAKFTVYVSNELLHQLLLFINKHIDYYNLAFKIYEAFDYVGEFTQIIKTDSEIRKVSDNKFVFKFAPFQIQYPYQQLKIKHIEIHSYKLHDKYENLIKDESESYFNTIYLTENVFDNYCTYISKLPRNLYGDMINVISDDYESNLWYIYADLDNKHITRIRFPMQIYPDICAYDVEFGIFTDIIANDEVEDDECWC